MTITILISIILFILLIFLMKSICQVYSLKKRMASQEQDLLANKNRREEFAMSMSRSQTNAKNLLTDPLTDLSSKEAFDSQYLHLVSQSKRFDTLFAIVVLDINKLAQVNEQYSRSTGDKVLIEIGHRLKKTLRVVDVVSRYEGDVFVMLLPNVLKPEVVVHAVERILGATSAPIDVDGHSLECSVSMGIAIYPFDGEDRAVLLGHANDAMKKAKSNGNNVFQFYQEETQILGERELSLKSSIKDGDFLEHVTLEYCPFYDTQKNEIVCIEVVASMDHPELGKISFSELARVSQYSSKMFELYEWMMTNSVKKYENSSQKNRLIFKFDLKQLASDKFAEKIIAIINKIATDKCEIILDLTDDVQDTSLEKFKDPMAMLNQSNIPISIGILVLGHFALSKINQVRFSYLKIDEKLVKDIHVREESRSILERILILASTMDIPTLTSGVNTKQQKDILQSLGCHIMQGKAVSV